MASFVWTGRTRQGVSRRGEISAKSREEVISLLRKQNILVTSIKPRSGLSLNTLPVFMASVKEKDLAVFTRQFATMIDAGLPLVQCLEILSTQTENPTLAKVIGDVRQDVEGGATYADALRKHPRAFDDLHPRTFEDPYH